MSSLASFRVLPADCPAPSGGKPTAASKAYADLTGALTCGVWRSEPNRIDVGYMKDEFCLILEGEVHFTDTTGTTEVYRAGDAFVVPDGFKGVWAMPVAVAKYYVLHTPKPPALTT